MVVLEWNNQDEKLSTSPVHWWSTKIFCCLIFRLIKFPNRAQVSTTSSLKPPISSHKLKNRNGGKVRNCLDAVALTLMWSIWCFRNRLLFSFSKPVKASLWDSIQSQSFLWISARNPKFHVLWINWVQNPRLTINSL